ncbi:MAG: ribosome maturation factor RimM [Terracidiphilus sp.]
MPKAPGAWVWLARICRPQGRKGEVFAEILTDFPEKFATRRQLWLMPEGVSAKAGSSEMAGEALWTPREVELTDYWLHKGGVVLHFAGVGSISAAEGLTGLIVAIPRAERAELAGGEAYISDLIGCALFDVSKVAVAGTAPVPVGVIEEVDRAAGPAPLLIVRGPVGEIQIPFAKSYLRRIDLEAKRVEMALPEGLVGLNTAGEA